MNMISELRGRVKTSGGAYITIEDYNKLQVEWIKRAKLDVSLNQLKADAFFEVGEKLKYEYEGPYDQSSIEEFFDALAQDLILKADSLV